jgi:two-component system, NarL family, sensor histidine kinase DesK
VTAEPTGRPAGPDLDGGPGQVRGPDGRLSPGGTSLWLLLLLWPAWNMWSAPHGPRWLALGLLVLFGALDVVLMSVGTTDRLPWWSRIGLLLALAALGTWLFVQGGDGGYFLYVFVAMAAANVLPQGRLAFAGVAAVTALAMATSWGASPSTIGSIGFATFISGFVILVLRRLFTTIKQLRRAREDLAVTAVAAERLRFSRDLHDLLGHSLSLIVVKAEVVRRLAERDPAAAAREAADIEKVGRQALVEVREAVTGYRQRPLSEELDGAREALAGAGIEPTVRLSAGPLDAGSDALLGWAVREGTTNAIRHSRATRCTIDIRRDADQVVLTVTDDGAVGGTGTKLGAGPGAGTGAGTGLRGLAERLAGAGGTVTAGPRPDGRGFRLTVTVPGRAGDG